MQNFKLAILIVAGVFYTQLISAQQEYKASHYGEPGDLYLYNRLPLGFSNEIVTQDGPDVTWDLSANLNLNTHLNQVVEPSEGINQFNFLTVCSLSGLSTFDCLAVWNSTDQAILLKDSLFLLDFTLYNLQRYQSKVSNLLLENFIGFTVDLGGTPTQAVIVYQNQDTVIHFPIVYEKEWTSSITYGLDLTPAGQNILYQSNQSRLTKVDGWGTLMTPYDTFDNVVRLRSDILRMDTILQNGTDTLTLIADQVEYMWFDTNYTLPVMTAIGLKGPNDSIIINSLEYVYEATCPTPTWTVEPGSTTYYLDGTGSVVVDFNVLNSNANTYAWDFGDGLFGNSEGSISHEYTAPGEYAVAVFGCMTNCLPLNNCSFQLIDFEILDTTTSVTNIDGKELGISVYPNPANESIHLCIPNVLVDQQYRILDMTGKLIQTGTMQDGTSGIDTKAFANGLYTLQLSSPSDPDAPIAFVRFIIIR
ncbi:MAG: T9SS type A sorting domain-containing protein [Saprospiraceae bacterium]|nr:T9SS type A sorting domain-containing protein [Saprospiraceae bacterium]